MADINAWLEKVEKRAEESKIDPGLMNIFLIHAINDVPLLVTRLQAALKALEAAERFDALGIAEFRAIYGDEIKASGQTAKAWMWGLRDAALYPEMVERAQKWRQSVIDAQTNAICEKEGRDG